jgi:mercuric ion binding protein
MGFSNQTETWAQLRGVHLCCGGCTDAVARAVESVPGVTCRCDMENGTVTLTAEDHASAQKALDAIADAGLHGETGDEHLMMRVERDVPPGKVRRLTVSGIHNCCEPCYEAIKGAIDTVEGVTGDTAGPKRTSFEVTGNFSAAELVRALNAAGFHAKVKA